MMAGGVSYNGWPASDDPNAIGIDSGFTAAGVKFPGGVKAGDVATVLGYVVDQMVTRVEPLIDNPDTGQPGYGCWGWNYRANVNNPSSLSCHSSGTAIDFNATLHPNGASGTFTGGQKATIYDILAEVGGSIQWGGDYSGTVDEMHFEVIVDAGYLSEVAAGLPSGGSSGGAPTPSPDEDEDDDMRPMIVQRANGVDYAHNSGRLITILSPDMYHFLTACHWIDTPHGEAEPVEKNLIEFVAAQVVAGGGVADPLI